MGKHNVITRDDIIKFIYFFAGAIIIALVYNSVFVPNDIVTGGVSGLAIVVKKMTGLAPSTFILCANAVLVVLSFITLGKKDTLRQLLGCIIYSLAISLTAPLGEFLSTKYTFSLLFLIIIAIIYGIAFGFVYRAGYSTGGFDILTTILAKKIKKAITETAPILNMGVLIVGFIVFKPVQIMYSLVVIFISNRITDAVLFSISSNKMIFVISKQSKSLSKYIMDDMGLGTTELKVHSGLFEHKKQMIMCIIHNSQYNRFKSEILKLDHEAFILANNCYQVSGGYRYNLIPF